MRRFYSPPYWASGSKGRRFYSRPMGYRGVKGRIYSPRAYGGGRVADDQEPFLIDGSGYPPGAPALSLP